MGARFNKAAYFSIVAATPVVIYLYFLLESGDVPATIGQAPFIAIAIAFAAYAAFLLALHGQIKTPSSILALAPWAAISFLEAAGTAEGNDFNAS